MKCSYHWNTLGFISPLPAAKLVIVIAGRPQQAMNAGGDDRQPPCGAFYMAAL